MDEAEVREMITREQSIVKIKSGVDKDVADQIRAAELRE